jgi:hypothetical protein
MRRGFESTTRFLADGDPNLEGRLTKTFSEKHSVNRHFSVWASKKQKNIQILPVGLYNQLNLYLSDSYNQRIHKFIR